MTPLSGLINLTVTPLENARSRRCCCLPLQSPNWPNPNCGSCRSLVLCSLHCFSVGTTNPTKQQSFVFEREHTCLLYIHMGRVLGPPAPLPPHGMGGGAWLRTEDHERTKKYRSFFIVRRHCHKRWQSIAFRNLREWSSSSTNDRMLFY